MKFELKDIYEKNLYWTGTHPFKCYAHICTGPKLGYQGTCTWWRHQMKTFPALLAICVGNSPVPGEFPTQRPVTRNFDVFFDLRLNKRLRKQSWGWWFGMSLHPLWSHCNEKCLCLGAGPSAGTAMATKLNIIKFIWLLMISNIFMLIRKDESKWPISNAFLLIWKHYSKWSISMALCKMAVSPLH